MYIYVRRSSNSYVPFVWRGYIIGTWQIRCGAAQRDGVGGLKG